MTYHALDTASRLAPTGKDPHHAAGEFRFQQCQTNKLEQEAAEHGLVLIGAGRNANHRTYRFTSCGHEQEIHTGAVRIGNFRCQQCLDDKLQSEAAEQGLVLIGAGRSHKYRTYRFIDCGHEQEIQTGAVRAGYFRCQQCLDEKLQSEASEHGLVLIGPGRNSQHRTYRFASCGHEQEIRTSAVRDGNFRCQQCLDEKLQSEAAEHGLVLIGVGRNRLYRIYRFINCGHEQEIQTVAVRAGAFRCQQCEETHMDLPSAVYATVVRAERHGSGLWLKLGKGKPGGYRTRQQDRASDDDVQLHPLFELPIATGREALAREQTFHKAARAKRLTPFSVKHPCAWYPDGGTELYPLTEKLMRLAMEHFPEAAIRECFTESFASHQPSKPSQKSSRGFD